MAQIRAIFSQQIANAQNYSILICWTEKQMKRWFH